MKSEAGSIAVIGAGSWGTAVAHVFADAGVPTTLWARDPKVKEHLGFSANQHLIAFLYIGYPEFIAEHEPRASFEDRTVWRE